MRNVEATGFHGPVQTRCLGNPIFKQAGLKAEGKRGNGEMEESRGSRQHMILAHEQTRKEVANLLHARVQSRLLVLDYWLKDCEDLVTGPQEVLDRLRNARTTLGEIIQDDLRSITRHLYPSIIHIGLPGALNSLAERFHSIFTMEIDIDHEVREIESSISSGLHMDLRLTLYRVAEEALTNVVKHSQASYVMMRVGISSQREMYLSIQDNGRGFDTDAAATGIGLFSMKDYAETLGGRLEVDSLPSQGTIVRMWLPIPEAARPLVQV